jgi:SAM-dependent methyltransferase
MLLRVRGGDPLAKLTSNVKEMQPDAKRAEALLKYISKEQRGIEIGAYHAPMAPRRLGFDSVSLDVFDAAALRARAKADPNISDDKIGLIEEVDLVGSAVEIAALVQRKFSDERFDYIVSSHNFEHLPNPIRFLQGCEQVLRPGGVLSMAIPDRRACFDYFRPVTALGEWLEAYRDERERPTAAQIFRQRSLSAKLKGKGAWSVPMLDDDQPVPDETLESAYAVWQEQTRDGQYIDTHCSVFTPSSFALNLTDMGYLGLTCLGIFDLSGPRGCEFHVHLRYEPDVPPPGREEFYRQRAAIANRMIEEQGVYALKKTHVWKRAAR